MASVQMPSYQDLLWPTLSAVQEKGGSASIEELSEVVPKKMALPEDILDIPHNEGPRSKLDYRASWARTHLKMIGALSNSDRGVWTITDFGRQIGSEEEVRQLVQVERTQRGRARRQSSQLQDAGEDEEIEELSWEDELLEVLRALESAAFERLCQRVLRESGFTKVEVTGRSGDGGIDGAGVLRVNLLSFHVRFQCKRYIGSVRSGEIRDFRGAMVGRADKGVFMTTGRFTKDAEREAVRDGAPAIDLIDGVELCRLLKELKLGVQTEAVENVHLQQEFFQQL